MIRLDGQRLVVNGPVTLATHVALRAACADLINESVTIDWTDVEAVDSSALALLLDWQRRTGRPLTHQHLPAGLTALAELYGVKQLLGL